MNSLAPNPVVEVHDLTVAYNRKPVLWDVDLALPAGQLICIVGPNGAGKSSLLKAMMQLIPSASGFVKIFGQDINKVRNRISYVPQRESVDWDFPASVYDVVMMGRYGRLGLFHSPGATDREIVRKAIEQTGLTGLEQRHISQLSGGQQQRVFLARALAQQAELYFMDEPFAGVDMATEAAIIALLKELKNQGKTVIVVHHDLQTVREYFDWMVLLNLRLVASGPVSQVFNEETLQQTYGGRLNVLSHVLTLLRNQQAPIRE